MKAESRTTTAEALLGLLSIRAMSGYEIKQMIEQSIGNFWSESFGQIYPVLKRLEREGLIAAEEPGVGKAGGTRVSRRFRLTARGEQRLQAWLPVPARPQVPRNELLLKLFFGADAPVAVMKEQIEATRAIYQADLKRYQAITTRIRKTRANLPGFPYWMIVVAYGRAEAKAVIAWANESLRALEELERAREAEKRNGRHHHAA